MQTENKIIVLQLITTMPTKALPRTFTVGRDVAEKDLATAAAISQVDGGAETKTRGQILWIRSISRLQQQVSPQQL